MNDHCPEGCGVALVEETRDVVDRGYHPGDPDAPSHDEQWLRCPSCGFEVEADAMLPKLVREDGREAPSENDPQFDPFHEESLTGVGR